MPVCGLLGEKLSHSRSPQIQEMLGNGGYRLFEVPRDGLADFMRSRRFDGVNVTVPYKIAVMDYCDALSEEAKEIGSVNTVVNDNGRLTGYNTDAYGFGRLLDFAGIDVRGAKALILGSGGASRAVKYILAKRGARETVTVSREGENNYGNISRHSDADVVINATPVGMYPKSDASPLSLKVFTALRGAVDVIYNPLRTEFLLEASELKIPNADGLYMLVAQAKRSADLFLHKQADDSVIDGIYKAVRRDMSDIVLVGMPGCGKTTIGKLLSQKTGMELYDTDDTVIRSAGMTITEIFAESGEGVFRRYETEALKSVCTGGRRIIATGGGAVLSRENRHIMRRYGVVIQIIRDTASLPTEGRPLSDASTAAVMYAVRRPLYEECADFTVINGESASKCADDIAELLKREGIL